MIRYQAARFADGSIAVRRLSDDPCDRATLCFESIRELEDELPGRHVEWVRGEPPGRYEPDPNEPEPEVSR